MNYIEDKTLKKKLCNILDYWNIPYTKEDINSYTPYELTRLVNMYDIKLNNVDNKNNSWYKEKNISS